MADVIVLLLNLATHTANFVGADIANVVLQDIKARWKTAKQPLHVLALAFHPLWHKQAVSILKHSVDKNGSWPNANNLLSPHRLACCASFCHKKHKLFASEIDSPELAKECVDLELKVC